MIKVLIEEKFEQCDSISTRRVLLSMLMHFHEKVIYILNAQLDETCEDV